MRTGPVTIGDLTRDGKLLEVGCMACRRHLYLDPAGLGLPDELPVPKAAVWLACSGCGAISQPNWQPIWARADARAQVCYSGPMTTAAIARHGHHADIDVSPAECPGMPAAAVLGAVDCRMPSTVANSVFASTDSGQSALTFADGAVKVNGVAAG